MYNLLTIISIAAVSTTILVIILKEVFLTLTFGEPDDRAISLCGASVIEFHLCLQSSCLYHSKIHNINFIRMQIHRVRRCSGNQVIFKGITSKFIENTVLVLIMEGIYEVLHCIGLRWHNIHTSFHDDRFSHSSNITVITSTF
jgi:hypothetical protein